MSSEWVPHQKGALTMWQTLSDPLSDALLIHPKLSCGRKHYEDAVQPGLLVSGRLWRWLSGVISFHRQQRRGQRWSSAFPLRKISLALFGSRWILRFGSMEARNAWVSHPYCRCAIKGSQHVFWLQSRSGETAQCFLQGRQVITVPVLFLFACWPSGVVSISRTTHRKPWRTNHRTILWL